MRLSPKILKKGQNDEVTFELSKADGDRYLVVFDWLDFYLEYKYT